VTHIVAGEARDKQTWSAHRLFEDLGAFAAGAVALFLLGSLLLLAAVQSPTMLQWTGTAVHNVQSGGIAYYSFHGENYTLNVPSPAAWSSTVYLDPADPSHAMFGKAVWRWSDIVLVGGPYTASILLLALAFTRRSRRRRLKDPNARQSFGEGLDRQTVSRLLDRQRKR
jgi:hypothetical protein